MELSSSTKEGQGVSWAGPRLTLAFWVGSAPSHLPRKQKTGVFREVLMALPRMLLVLGWAGTENPAGQPVSPGRLNTVN